MRARATPASRADARLARRRRSTDVDGAGRARPRERRRPRRGRARGAARRRARRRARGRGHRAASARRAAAARLEGSKAFAKEVMAAAGVPTAALRGRRRPSRTGMAAIDRLPGRDQGRRARRRQGRRDRRPTRRRRARRSRTLLRRAALRRRAASSSRSTSTARSSRCWRCATASARCRWRPRRTTSGSSTATTGPNTGGMGSYSPVPGRRRRARRGRSRATVHQPVVDELARRGTPFHGVLYAGLMLTADGPKVLEFNVRFGDPETQAVLPRLRSDLLELLERATRPGRPRAAPSSTGTSAGR